MSISCKEDFMSAVKDANFPMILKPSDGRGSRGVLFIDDKINHDWAYEHSSSSCDNKQLMRGL